MQRVVVLAAVMAGCGGGCNGDLQFNQDNNYTFSGQLGLEMVEVVSQTDLTIDWSAVSVDIRGRDVTAAPDQAVLLKCEGNKEEVLAQLDANALAQSDCIETFIFENEDDASQASATQFAIAGTSIDPTRDLTEIDTSQENWIASILNTSAVGDDPLMTVFFDVADANTGTEVALTDSSSTFTYTVDLSSAPVITGSGTVLDWSAVTTDVFGNDFNDLRGSQVIIARYDDDVAAIEADFLRLEDNAVELYRMSAFGLRTVDLSLAETEEGSPFGGFTSEGTWLVGITCPDCLNPAPLLLAVVEAG